MRMAKNAKCYYVLYNKKNARWIDLDIFVQVGIGNILAVTILTDTKTIATYLYKHRKEWVVMLKNTEVYILISLARKHLLS
jgi:hypothetical protein